MTRSAWKSLRNHTAMDSSEPWSKVRFVSRDNRQAGFAYLMALVMIAAVVIGSAAVLESVTATVRRDRENEMIWRGNQYSRAIRMYYRKVGRYPTSVDDLMQGVPGLRFLRQAYKDPMNKEDGAWRFIYLNQTGQIVGSSRYASLQQMAVMDALGLQPGQIPQGLAGQPGVSVASMASGTSGSGLPAMGGMMGGLTPALPYRVISSDNPEEAQQQYAQSPEGQAQLQAQQNTQAAGQTSGQTSGDNSQSALIAQLQSQYPNATPDQVQAFLTQQGATPDQIQAALSALSQAQAQSQNQSQQQNQNQSAFNNSGQSQSAFGNSGQGSAFSSGSSAFGSSAFGSSSFNSGALQSQGQNGQNGPLGTNPMGQTQSLVAAANSGILQQKPTGPVDGPVIGGFLTGVGSKVDRKSVIWYHGAKKYVDWEFIWNPLEDQAAALQQQINQTQSTGAQGGLPVANPFGGSTGPNSNSGTNPSPQPAPNPSQPQQ